MSLLHFVNRPQSCLARSHLNKFSSGKLVCEHAHVPPQQQVPTCMVNSDKTGKITGNYPSEEKKHKPPHTHCKLRIRDDRHLQQCRWRTMTLWSGSPHGDLPLGTWRLCDRKQLEKILKWELVGGLCVVSCWIIRSAFFFQQKDEKHTATRGTTSAFHPPKIFFFLSMC